MRNSLLLVVTAAVMSLSMQAPSFAQSSPFGQSPPELAMTFKAEDIASILRDAGYRAELGADSESPRVRTGMGGYNVGVYLYNCDNDRNCRNLQFSLGLRDMQKYPMSSINKWNTEKRFAKATLDDEGNLWLRADVYFYGGVTKQMVSSTAQLFDDLVGDFRGTIKSWVAARENPFASASP